MKAAVPKEVVHVLHDVRVWRAQGDALQVDEIDVGLALPFPGDGIAAAGDVFADFEDGEGGWVALLAEVETDDDVAGF